jgi:hypothetical protein
MNEYEKLVAQMATRIFCTGQFTIRQSVQNAIELLHAARIRCAEENEAVRR